MRLQEATGGPGGDRMPQEAREGTRKQQDATGGNRRPQEAPGGNWNRISVGSYYFLIVCPNRVLLGLTYLANRIRQRRVSYFSYDSKLQVGYGHFQNSMSFSVF